MEGSGVGMEEEKREITIMADLAVPMNSIPEVFPYLSSQPGGCPQAEKATIHIAMEQQMHSQPATDHQVRLSLSHTTSLTLTTAGRHSA